MAVDPVQPDAQRAPSPPAQTAEASVSGEEMAVDPVQPDAQRAASPPAQTAEESDLGEEGGEQMAVDSESSQSPETSAPPDEQIPFKSDVSVNSSTGNPAQPSVAGGESGTTNPEEPRGGAGIPVVKTEEDLLVDPATQPDPPPAPGMAVAGPPPVPEDFV